ncbi:hypothetical protein KR200_003774, partial [Drosophila serrata]
MTSAWVLIIASVLHFGLRRSCFLNIEQLPMLPDTLFARHIAYCAILHFLYDQELLPTRYRRRMGLIFGFLVELILGIVFMEVLGQWLWWRVEHIIYKCLLLALRTYGDENPELYQYLEKTFMRGLMTALAGLLWLNAYAATEPPQELQVAQVATAKASLVKQKHRNLSKRKEQQTHRIKGQEKVSQEEQKQRQKLKLKMKLKLKQKAEQNRKQLLEQERDKDKDQEQKQEQKPKQKKQAVDPELPMAEEE